ncbi:MAG: hypothetical protein PVF68_07915 [Acidobacteriota bacterium]|jgi:hypothetical protein
MATETRMRVSMPDPKDPAARVDETWTVLTHPSADEWWSEVLDGASHPCTDRDEFGFDTVRKFYGETPEESRQAAVEALEAVVRERGGVVRGPFET